MITTILQKTTINPSQHLVFTILHLLILHYYKKMLLLTTHSFIITKRLLYNFHNTYHISKLRLKFILRVFYVIICFNHLFNSNIYFMLKLLSGLFVFFRLFMISFTFFVSISFFFKYSLFTS